MLWSFAVYLKAMNQSILKSWMEPYRFRKGFVVLFILFFLFCEGMENLHIFLPPTDDKQTLSSFAYRKFQALVASLWDLGEALSIAEHWTMYSWAEPDDSQLLILGVNRKNLGVVLPIPSQVSRSFLQANLIDYHENKWLEGTWKYPILREMIAHSMCRLYGKKYDLKSILFVETSRRILPWDEAAKLHRHYDLHTTELKYGEYPCSG